MDKAREYSNGEVTIVWKQELCAHSGICARGLSSVFKPKEKPWIHPEGATSEEIVNQVRKCPSGALTVYYNKEGKNEQ